MTTEPLAALPPPEKMSIFYLLRHWLRQSYDEAGPILLGGFFFTVAAFAASAPAFLLAARGAQGSGALLMGEIVLASFAAWMTTCAWLSLNRYLEQILTFQYPGWFLFWRVFPRYLAKALGMVLLLGGGAGILAFDFLAYPKMLASLPFLRWTAITLTAWMAIFLFIVQVHLAPFLVHQERSFFTALKRAAMVAAWRPFRALFLLVIQGILFLSCLQVPPLVFLVPGLFAVLTNLSLLVLLDEWRDPYEKTSEAVRAGA
jgi:uncharacterized membrane protein YesL